MRESWSEFFAAERQIKKVAIHAGIPKLRAAQLAREIACRPLPRATQARLLARVLVARHLANGGTLPSPDVIAEFRAMLDAKDQQEQRPSGRPGKETLSNRQDKAPAGTTRQRALTLGREIDPTIVAAHHLLVTLEKQSAPNIASIHVRTLPDVAARVEPDFSISIDPESFYYDAAQHGDVLGLSMILAHEQFHVVNGPDERSAYDASIRFLQRHHADQTLIDRVTRTRDAVLSKG